MTLPLRLDDQKGLNMSESLNRLSFRKSPRIRGFDYSTVNYYFVTICTHKKKCIFYHQGRLNHNGLIAKACLEDIPNHFAGYRLDKFVVMPNHIHAILVIETEDAKDLPTVVGQYKSIVAKRIHKNDPEIMVWQRPFHDHVIRNQRRYELIWNYIDTNPLRWRDDCFYMEDGRF